MPPEDPVAEPAAEAIDEPPESDRTGLADWLWVPLLTAAILAVLVLIGRSTFVA
jgi:hypothetical protein